MWHGGLIEPLLGCFTQAARVRLESNMKESNANVESEGGSPAPLKNAWTPAHALAPPELLLA